MIPANKSCVALALLLLAGCGAKNIESPLRREANYEAGNRMRQVRPLRPQTVDIVHQPFIKADEISYRAEGADVVVKVVNAPFYNVLHGVARPHGWTLMMADNVDSSRPVSVEIDGMTPEEAVRMIAGMAGYVAVIDRENRRAVIAETATQTYKLPTNVMQRMGSAFKVGGNPISGSGGSGSGGLSAMQAQFEVNGQIQNNSDALVKFITQLAGRNAQVQVMPELGLIQVSSNAQALKRVHDFLLQFCKDAMAQVEIQASIIEVRLENEFKYGIDWKKLMDTPNNFLRLSNADVLNASTTAMTAMVTTASVTAVIDALKKRTAVNVMTQPYILAMNHTPSLLFDGNQVPYLGSVQSSVGAVGGPTTTDAQTQFAVDGVSLSIQPDILNNQEVQISLVPVLSSVNTFSNFQVGDTNLTAPSQSVKQSYMKVLAHSGRTLILGGSRYSRQARGKKGVPGLSDIPLLGSLTSGLDQSEVETEVVILMSTNIIPAPKYDPLVGESL